MFFLLNLTIQRKIFRESRLAIVFKSNFHQTPQYNFVVVDRGVGFRNGEKLWWYLTRGPKPERHYCSLNFLLHQWHGTFVLITQILYITWKIVCNMKIMGRMYWWIGKMKILQSHPIFNKENCRSMSGGGTSPEQTKNLLKSGGDNHFTKGFRPSVKSQFLEETVPNSDRGLWKNKKLYNTLPFKEQILIRNFFFKKNRKMQ